MKRNNLMNRATAISIFFLLLVNLAVFLYTVEIRKPWFGELSMGHHQWLSGSTIKFAKNWYADGAVNLKFGMVEDPASVEFPTLASRHPYPSYPPGAILPVYLISKLRNHPPSPGLLMKYNLLNHFFIAFFLGLTLFYFCRQTGYSYSTSAILATIPIISELLLPAPLYWHQNVFFADQAIILPFVLYIFIEIYRNETLHNPLVRRCLDVAQTMVMAYGVMTDWLFVFILLTVYLKRLFFREMGENVPAIIKKTVVFWFLPAMMMVLFVLQLYLLDLLIALKEKFIWRSGMNPIGREMMVDFFSRFWDGYIRNAYGKTGLFLIWTSFFVFFLSFFYLLFRKLRSLEIDKKMIHTVSLIGMLTLPCFMQIYFLKNHSYVHDFSTLKFSVILSAVPFVLIPVLISLFLKTSLNEPAIEGLSLSYKGRRKNIGIALPLILVVVVCGLYLHHVHPNYKNFFPGPMKSLRETGTFISENTIYEDVVFSPDFEVQYNPPQMLSFSMKRVYKVSSLKEIHDKTEGINVPFYVNIMTTGPESEKALLNSELHKLTGLAHDVRRKEAFNLYKIRGDIFKRLYAENSEAR